jgi:nucleoside-diphosphate-sugar epimerase
MNVSTERTTRINELAEMIISFSNKRLRIRNVPGPIGPYYRYLDWGAARRELGWVHRTALEDGIERTYDWIAKRMAERSGDAGTPGNGH